MKWQSLITTLPLLGLRELPSFGAIDDSTAFSGRLRLGVFCHGGVAVTQAGGEGCSGATCVGIGGLVER